MKTYNIQPVPKPRQTRSDKWKQRPCVMRYRAFADSVRKSGVEIGDTVGVTFFLPMPPSWSKKKRKEMDGRAHQQKPDIDNLVKALLDAVFDDDSHVYFVRAEKYWSESGSFQIHHE